MGLLLKIFPSIGDIHRRTQEMNEKLENIYMNQIFHIMGKQNLKGHAISAAIPDSVGFGKWDNIDELWKLWCDDNKNNDEDFFRFFAFIVNLEQIEFKNVEGAFAELGVYKGNSAGIMNYYAKKTNRYIYLFDTFEGFSNDDLKGKDANKPVDAFSDTSLDIVKKRVGEAEYVQGYFPDSLCKNHLNEHYAFVSLDCDLYKPMLAGLEFFYPRMNKGGIIFCHDYSSGHWEGCKSAIDEFCEKNNVSLILLPDKSGTAVICK